MKDLAISKARTKKHPKPSVIPKAGIVGVKAKPKAESKANNTHLKTIKKSSFMAYLHKSIVAFPCVVFVF